MAFASKNIGLTGYFHFWFLEMICETAPLNGAKSEAKRRKQMNVVRLINFANLRGKDRGRTKDMGGFQMGRIGKDMGLQKGEDRKDRETQGFRKGEDSSHLFLC